MASWKPFIELKTNTGRPIKRDGVTITSEAQALTLRLPYWGFVWNRPVAVLVERDGQRERFPIVDVTRVAVLGMAGTTIAFSLGMILVRFLGRGTAGD